jgi:hypothetical protein
MPNFRGQRRGSPAAANAQAGVCDLHAEQLNQSNPNTILSRTLTTRSGDAKRKPSDYGSVRFPEHNANNRTTIEFWPCIILRHLERDCLENRAERQLNQLIVPQRIRLSNNAIESLGDDSESIVMRLRNYMPLPCCRTRCGLSAYTEPTRRIVHKLGYLAVRKKRGRKPRASRPEALHLSRSRDTLSKGSPEARLLINCLQTRSSEITAGSG